MASNLGKRKERDEKEVDGDAHGSTLFVSNLPYNATSVDLETLFSDIAPVRTAFVVTEHGTGVSKGVGYVSFAMKEDAEACFKQVSEEGLTINKRKIRIQWADKKMRKPENGEKPTKDAQPKAKTAPRPREPVARTPHDPLAVRTIIIAGLPSPLDSHTLWKKTRKCPGAETLTYPAKNASGEDDPSTAHVLFNQPSKASAAVDKLHAHVYKGSLLSVTLKKRLEVLAKPVKAKKAQEAGQESTTAAPNRASRLIVRNLPFNATEQDLRALFLPYGPIHSITLPKADPPKTDDESKQPTRNKGFAFVWMLSKKDAERALEGCNGKAIRAGFAEELVAAKQKRKKQLRLEKKMKNVSIKDEEMKDATGAETVEEKEKEDEEGEEEREDKASESPSEAEEESDEEDDDKDDDERDKKQHATERVIAVDWALSKEKWQEEVSKMEEKADSDVEMGSSESGSDSEEESDDEEALGVHDGESDSEAGSSQDGFSDDERDSDEEEPTKPSLPAPEAGTTLFVRNVPYIATEDELRTLFRAFGPLRYARITMDPATGRSRGTGFACFWNKEDADKVIEQSEILRAETTGLNAAPKKNPFSLPSILTPDPSSSLARSLVLHGRTLDVVRAVTRETATKLREEGEKLREKQDKRNMYLLREGLIHPNSPAAASLSPADIERRTASYNSRRALLKSNPSLFISRTRLSVRQVPVWVSERGLKRLAVHAVREFGREVRKGEREGLSVEEMEDREGEGAEGRVEQILKKDKLAGADDAKEDGGKNEAAGKGKKGKGRDTGVKQTKVVRQNERVDPLTGKGRSKGYGFIEMHKHADALKVLRWANNNAAVGPLLRSWFQDELKDNLKKEKAKPEAERDEARILRMKEELERGGAKDKAEGKERGTLIVEFSIENVQVVQRREMARLGGMKTEGKDGAKREHSEKGKGKDEARGRGKQERKGAGEKGEKREGKGSKRGREESESPKKRRKIDSSADKEKKDANPAKEKKEKKDAKPFNPVGAVIGRKRKERKMGKKK